MAERKLDNFGVLRAMNGQNSSHKYVFVGDTGLYDQNVIISLLSLSLSRYSLSLDTLSLSRL